MPTQHVDPGSEELLQTVANSLLKARKVVVITGAGISTNSGIPDFRSENGLYSLIQAHFDAAARTNQSPDSTSQGGSDTNEGDNERDFQEGPAPKRRKLSCGPIIFNRRERLDEKEAETRLSLGEPIQDEHPNNPTNHDDLDLPSSPTKTTGNVNQVSTPKATRTPNLAAMPTTSPLSSPPMEEIVLPPSSPESIFQPRSLRARRELLDIAIPASSSPLSSPPPVLFEPHPPTSPSITSSSRRSSTSQCEMDLTSNSLSASQSSSSRNSLPNMKGKDLFDASIWADPLRTSVFYTFATSLRQKVKDCEPTSSHRFISHLRDRKKLVRCYTQNIDRIEEKVGLSTSLEEGPGSRGRFSRRSTANGAQLSKMVEDTAVEPRTPVGESHPTLPTQPTDDSDAPKTPLADSEASTVEQSKPPPKLEQVRSSGVECVFLHGSLESLRCFLCGRVTCWNDIRESETMSGQQPECPHCVGATAAREERGKRALGVGKLRPDIVLYGEEHPNAHLISPIVTHDLALCPDMLLILGTSLRVHGLKVMVREFAKAIHSRGGTVVFVNFTKPPESSWGDVIDYWVQWDCDAWVSDLQNRVPKLWEAPKEPKGKPPAKNPMALRDTKVTGAYWTQKIVGELRRIAEFHDPSTQLSPSSSAGAAIEMSITVESILHQQPDIEESIAVLPPGAEPPSSPPSEPAPPAPSPSPPAPAPEPAAKSSEPAAESSEPAAESFEPAAKSSEPAAESFEPAAKSSEPAAKASEPAAKTSTKPSAAQNALRPRPRPRRTRKSAPGALERGEKKKPPSTLNPNHGRALKQETEPEIVMVEFPQPTLVVQPPEQEAPATPSSSIWNSVKANPRLRKRKKIYGEEEVLSSPPQIVSNGSERSNNRRSSSGNKPAPKPESELTLPPLRVMDAASPEQLDQRPRPMEPKSPPQGPQPGLRVNVRLLRSQSLAMQEAIKNQAQAQAQARAAQAQARAAEAQARAAEAQSRAAQAQSSAAQAQSRAAQAQWNEQHHPWTGTHEDTSGQWEAQQRQEQLRYTRQQREELLMREQNHNDKEKDVALALVGLKVSALRQWGDTWHVAPNRCR